MKLKSKYRIVPLIISVKGLEFRRSIRSVYIYSLYYFTQLNMIQAPMLQFNLFVFYRTDAIFDVM